MENSRSTIYNIKLPELPENDIKDGVRFGRSPKDGYTRGKVIHKHFDENSLYGDNLFRLCLENSVIGGTLVNQFKLLNIYLIIAYYFHSLESKNIIEFGSYKGGSAIFMATVLKNLYPEAKIYALDTYKGMPTTDKNIDLHTVGDFNDSNLEEFKSKATHLGLDNIVYLDGLFEESIPKIEKDRIPFALAHIDCDIYHSVKYCQENIYELTVKGGYLVYDDADFYTCLGATQAADEFMLSHRIHKEQVWPHWVIEPIYFNKDVFNWV